MIRVKNRKKEAERAGVGERQLEVLQGEERTGKREVVRKAGRRIREKSGDCKLTNSGSKCR